MSDDFAFGLLAGAFVFSLVHWCVMASYRGYLLSKSDCYSPAKIGDEFYYIVPESEYVGMNIKTQEQP